jgi:hypothetical protein
MQPSLRSYFGVSVPRGVLLAAGVIWLAGERRARGLEPPPTIEDVAFLAAADAVEKAMAELRAAPPAAHHAALAFNGLVRALRPALAVATKRVVLRLLFPVEPGSLGQEDGQ